MIDLVVERAKRRMTQDNLAMKARVSRTTICNIEKKGIEQIPVKTLRKLAKALDTTVSELFFSDEE